MVSLLVALWIVFGHLNIELVRPPDADCIGVAMDGRTSEVVLALNYVTKCVGVAADSSDQDHKRTGFKLFDILRERNIVWSAVKSISRARVDAYPTSFSIGLVLVRKASTSLNFDRQMKDRPEIESRCVPSIFNSHPDHRTVRVAKTLAELKFEGIARWVGNGLGYPDAPSIDSHTLSGNKSSPDKDYTQTSYGGNPNRDDEHAKSPQRHILLSFQIIIGLMICFLSAHALGETSKPVDKATFRHDGPAGLDAFLACVGIVQGGALAFVGLILLVG